MSALRKYQADAVEAVIEGFRQGGNYLLIHMAAGTGKSHIVSELATRCKTKVLCIQPSKILLEQNFKKFIIQNAPHGAKQAGYFSASKGRKDATKRVIYGTLQTVRNHLNDGSFDNVGLVVIDESHQDTETTIKIAESIQSVNPDVKVCGMTATPYRLKTGYIYKCNTTLRAYYSECVYRYNNRDATQDGYLTPAKIIEPSYKIETSKLETKASGDYKLTGDEIEKQNKRLTYKICQHIKYLGERRQAGIVFAQTIQHAEEICGYLGDQAEYMHSGTKQAVRDAIIKKLNDGKIKFLVNVELVTTGFDCPLVDMICILRPTTSVGLHEQMWGRGDRLLEGKHDFWLIDYAENIERLYQNSDIYEPVIEVKESKKAAQADIICPECKTEQKAAMKKNIDGWISTKYGYWCDLMGVIIEASHFKPKCENEDCDHYWTSKICPGCKTHNTATTRYCRRCKYELVDPNKKLVLNDDSFDERVNCAEASVYISKSNKKMLQLKINNNVVFHVMRFNLKKLKLYGSMDQVARLINEGQHGWITVRYTTDSKGNHLKEFNQNG